VILAGANSIERFLIMHCCYF